MTTSPPPVISEDLERQKASRRSCRCLDCCLVITMVLLTMAVASMAAFYMAWERPHQEKSVMERIQRDRLRSSVQLQLDGATIANKIIQWHSPSNLATTFLGQDYSYNRTTQELLVKHEGFYQIYSQIGLKCVEKGSKCTEEQIVSLSILKNNEHEPILKLNIHAGNSGNSGNKNSPPSSFSGHVQFFYANTKIKAQLKTNKETVSWQLSENTFLGLVWFSKRLPEELQSV